MLNITEKIQHSAEEFDKEFPMEFYHLRNNKVIGDFPREFEEFEAKNFKDFLITSQKELANSIIEEFVGEEDKGHFKLNSHRSGWKKGYNQRIQEINSIVNKLTGKV